MRGVHRRGCNGEIGLAVELKVGNNGLTPAQKEWRDALLAEGCEFAVVHSLDEFKPTLDKYLHGAPTPARQRRPGSLRRTDALPFELD